MSSSAELIAALDDALAQAGETITLRRVVGTGSNTVNVDCGDVPAIVRAFKPEELIGGISQTDSNVIISPSVLLAKQWAPAQTPSWPEFPWLPQVNNKTVIQGRVRSITFVKPIVIGGEVVRIELTVAG